MKLDDNINSELALAEEYIRETGSNVFLTGRAGTGKTTFLKSLKVDCPKRLAVAAPTGVAAINAGGVTLHSLFQLPFGPFIPGSEYSRAPFRFTRAKKDLIRSLDLLVIDEISMVRADLLDGVDHVLRNLRRNNRPFGGVQLLMIGDLFQLPPVVKNEDWQLLRSHYQSPYFFYSKALAETDMVTIELQKIYRQTDKRFIGILNQIRDNTDTPQLIKELNTRVKQDFSPADDSGYITLCSHNNRADAINRSRLAELSTPIHEFNAEVEGDFPDHIFPTPSSLQLKTGAQVMFIRNDSSENRRYFNGKIGQITHIAGDSIKVKCPDDREEIEVEEALWENIAYQVDETTQEIQEKKLGSFRQYPLKPAWAITIHKSQGLTFDRAIIDAEAAFAHGQVYVALSRCRNLEGLVLSTPLSAKAIHVDSEVLHFHSTTKNTESPSSELTAAKIGFQQKLLLECFDFKTLDKFLHRLLSFIRANRELIRLTGGNNLPELAERAEKEIFQVSMNFQRQLYGLFQHTSLPCEDEVIVERLGKAADYFQEKMDEILISSIPSLQIDTDNKELRKRSRNTLKLLNEELWVKQAAIRCCHEGFSPSQYFRAISAAWLRADKAATRKSDPSLPNYTESDIEHPELFNQLKEWRHEKAQAENIPHYQVLHQKTLVQLAVNLPDSPEAMLKIKGIGKKLFERYGEELNQLIARYRKKHKIDTVVLPAHDQTEVKEPKSASTAADTKAQTLELFGNGLSIAEIAEKRQLTTATIEKHLAHHIKTGKLAITSFFSTERLKLLSKEIESSAVNSLTEIKQNLSTTATYGEIRFIQAYLEYSSASESE